MTSSPVFQRTPRPISRFGFHLRGGRGAVACLGGQSQRRWIRQRVEERQAEWAASLKAVPGGPDQTWANKFPPPEHPMPDELHFVIDRARKLVLPPPGSVSTGNKPRKQPSLAQWRPNEANAILYQRGSGHVLGAHCDHRAMSGPILATLSLAGEATMTYTKAQQPPAERHRVTLPRRSIQIQTGTVARFGTSLCMASTTRTCRRRLASGYQ